MLDKHDMSDTAILKMWTYPSVRMRCLNDDNLVHHIVGLMKGDLKNIHLIREEDH